MPLASGYTLTGFALGIETVEGLVQTLLGSIEAI